MAGRKKAPRDGAPRAGSRKIVKARATAEPAYSPLRQNATMGEKGNLGRRAAIKRDSESPSGRPLSATEAVEVDAFVDVMRALVAEHEIAREVLSSDAPIAKHHKPAALKLQRALQGLAHGAAGRSLRALHKLLRGQDGFKPAPTRFKAEERDMTIAMACDAVAGWLTEPPWSETDEYFAAKWSACSGPESVAAAAADDPHFARWLENRPSHDSLMTAQAWTQEARRLVDPEASEFSAEEWAAEFEQATRSSDVEAAMRGADGRRSGPANAAQAIVAELSGRPATATRSSKALSAEAVHKAAQRGKALLARGKTPRVRQ